MKYFLLILVLLINIILYMVIIESKIYNNNFNGFKNTNINNNNNNNNNNDEIIRDVFFYMDANIDDFFALQALAIDYKSFNIKGICVSGTGFATPNQGADNVLRILSFMSNLLRENNEPLKNYLLNIPVSIGSSQTVDSMFNLEISILNSTIQVRNDTDTIWETRDEYFPPLSSSLTSTHALLSNKSCIDLMIDSISDSVDSGRKMNILSTGPATDLAMLVNKRPDVIEYIDIVSQMGGTLEIAGNVFTYRNNTVAEFNVFLDIKAFETILNSFGNKLILNTLDAICYNPVSREYYYNVINNTKSKSGEWLKSLMENLILFYGDSQFFNDLNIKGKGFYTWDFESYRSLSIKGCDREELVSLSLSPETGKLTIIPNNDTSRTTIKTRICTFINSTLSHSLFSYNYWYLLP